VADHLYAYGPGTDQVLSDVALNANGTVAGKTLLFGDHEGSIRQEIDSSGTKHFIEYDGFGNIIAGSLNTIFGYTGQQWDAETGLYYYKARYYDPQQGRFISEDPTGLGEDINMYRYVGNNPISNTDPTGLCSLVSGWSTSMSPLDIVSRSIGTQIGFDSPYSLSSGSGYSNNNTSFIHDYAYYQESQPDYSQIKLDYGSMGSMDYETINMMMQPRAQWANVDFSNFSYEPPPNSEADETSIGTGILNALWGMTPIAGVYSDITNPEKSLFGKAKSVMDYVSDPAGTRRMVLSTIDGYRNLDASARAFQDAGADSPYVKAFIMATPVANIGPRTASLFTGKGVDSWNYGKRLTNQEIGGVWQIPLALSEKPVIFSIFTHI
jgi:RHS repeat-associated protein